MGRLFLVRHGQASWFDDNYDRLSALGERQALLLGEHWARSGATFDRVFCGPRLRQRRSAEIACDAGRLPMPVEVPDLDEMRIESIFREHMPELFAKHPHLQALGDALVLAEGDDARGNSMALLFESALRLWVQGEISGPGVESWDDFKLRVRNVVRTLTTGARRQRVLAFTSAGPVAAAVQAALSTADEPTLLLAFRVRNSSFSEFLFAEDRFSLATFNETPHLRDAALITVR